MIGSIINMGQKFDNFKIELKKNFKNIGSVAKRVLSAEENPSMEKLDADINKAMHQFE